MTPETIRCFALIVAAHARIAGMEAENAHLIACGNSVMYGEEAFFNESNFLETIATQVINQ